MSHKPLPHATRERDGAFAVVICGERILIDETDVALVTSLSWTVSRRRNGKIYVRTSVGSTYLHRILTGADAGMHVDHWNGDPRDNRRANLRVCSSSQNGANSGSRGGTSRFKGVSMDRRSGTWHASIKVNRRRSHLGSYALEEDAALAYDLAALEAWGEFASLNLPAGSHDRPPPERLRVGRMATANRWGTRKKETTGEDGFRTDSERAARQGPADEAASAARPRKPTRPAARATAPSRRCDRADPSQRVAGRS